MKRCASLLTLVVLLGPSGGHAEERSRQDLLDVATRYLAAREATMQAAARPEDVAKALSFCLPSLVYEHPRVGIRLAGLDEVRAGMLDFLGSSRNASIKVTTSLPGVDMIAVQTDVRFQAEQGETWQPVRRKQVWVFEFEGSKIKRIIEYW